MSSRFHADEVHDLNEGAWAYLSLWDGAPPLEDRLLHSVIEACEESGWPAISWSSPVHKGNALDSGHFFEGMSHAVEHADVVVVLMGSSSAMTDAELAFAYQHKRPVVGLCLEEDGAGGSEVRAMLGRYGRARLVECADIDDCAAGLKRALADPKFAETIREAAAEHPGDA